MVLGFIRRHTFADGECWETREGHCRLDPNLAAHLSPWIIRLRSAVQPKVREMVEHLRSARTTQNAGVLSGLVRAPKATIAG